MRAQHLAHPLQVVQVGTRMVAAGAALAGRVQRALIIAPAGVADLQVAKAGEQPPVAGVAGGHHAVEHVDATGDAVEQVLGRAHPHQVAGPVGGQPVADVVQDAQHVFLGLAHRKAPYCIALEADVRQARQRLVAQVLEHAALHDPEQGVGVLAAQELVAAAACPAQRQLHRAGGLFMGGGAAIDLDGRAFIEHHGDVRIQRTLHLHRDLGREKELVAVDRRGKAHAFFRDLAQIPQAPDLEAARIGQDGTLPAVEAVQPAQLLHHGCAGPQPQVEGVAQNDARAHRLQVGRRHALDGAVGAHRHEDRGFDFAVVEPQRALAGQAVGVVQRVVQHDMMEGGDSGKRLQKAGPRQRV